MICLVEEEEKPFFEGTPKCKCKLHIHIQCLQTWLEVNQPRQCPLCRTEWSQTAQESDGLENTRCCIVICILGFLSITLCISILGALR